MGVDERIEILTIFIEDAVHIALAGGYCVPFDNCARLYIQQHNLFGRHRKIIDPAWGDRHHAARSIDDAQIAARPLGKSGLYRTPAILDDLFSLFL